VEPLTVLLASMSNIIEARKTCQKETLQLIFARKKKKRIIILSKDANVVRICSSSPVGWSVCL